MSILQEYERIKNELGNGINKGMELYLENNPNLFLSDLYYKKLEYDKFYEWFKNYLLPFHVIEIDDTYSLVLNQEDFDKQIFEIRLNDNITGTGYDYESLFRTYIDKNLSHLSRYFSFDSEAGMFCVNSYSKKAIEELAFELSNEMKNDKFKDYVSKMENYEFYL